MSRPLSDDDRIVELEDDWVADSAPGGWEPPGDVEARTGTSTDDDRRLLDDVPPHWG